MQVFSSSRKLTLNFVFLRHKQVADLNSLRAETHKFESHYIDKLVGKSSDDIGALICSEF